MSRLQLLLVSLVVGVAACSGSSDESTTTTEDDAVTTTAISADTSPDSETTTTPGPTTTFSDRPLAPDFTLELADGGEYTLSQGAKPVYLVFWAEW